MLAEYQRHRAPGKRMLRARAFQRRALDRGEHPRFGGTHARGIGLDQTGRQYEVFAVDLNEPVLQFRMNRDGLIRRQRPRRGRPDHVRGRGLAIDSKAAAQLGRIRGREPHVDGKRLLVLIFDLGLGE